MFKFDIQHWRQSSYRLGWDVAVAEAAAAASDGVVASNTPSCSDGNNPMTPPLPLMGLSRQRQRRERGEAALYAAASQLAQQRVERARSDVVWARLAAKAASTVMLPHSRRACHPPAKSHGASPLNN